MCVEFCWCLCIHKISFRGSCYFFSSVHGYDGVSRLINLVFTNVILRTYFMDSRKTDLEMPVVPEDGMNLFVKSLYFLATTATALLIFRAVEKEWRQLMKWTTVVFLAIEVVALCMYFALHPNSYNSANCILTISTKAIFDFFYVISLFIYLRQLAREEKESEWKFQQSDWEPRFLNNSNRSPGGLASGFGSLGFGENTIKWLEAEKVIPHPQLIDGDNPFLIHTLSKTKGICDLKEKENDGKFEVRYEVCKSIK